jgi:hypothetical protein
MARPLRVQTDRSPAKKIPFSESIGGQAFESGTGAQIDLHVVPEGYQDEVHLWVNNPDPANNGRFLWRFGIGASNDQLISMAADTIVKAVDGVPIRGIAGGLGIEVLSITETMKLTGYVIRSAINV